MAHINTARLVLAATEVSHLGYRAQQVQQDPAVQKAWRDAGSDVAVAASSVVRALSETHLSWRRAGLAAEADLRLAT